MRVRALIRFLTWLMAALVLVVALRPSLAHAADAQVAIHIEGPGAEAARARVAAQLPKSASVVDAKTFDRALATAGQKGAFGKALAPGAPRDRVAAIAKNAGTAVHADAVVLGRVTKAGKGQELTVVWVDVAGGGAVAADRAVPAGDDAAIRSALAPGIDKLGGAPASPATTPTATPPTPPPATTPPPEQTPPSEPAASPADKADAAPAQGATHDVGTELFEIGAAIDLGGRRFDYKDPLPEQATLLRSHRVFGTVGLDLNGAVYPLALSGKKVLRDIGLTFDGSHAFGVTSKLPGGTQVDSSYDRYDIGLRGRFRTGGTTAPVIGLGAGYGRRTFGFAATPPNLDGSLPAVSYSQLRGGLDARFPVSIAAIVVGADYILPLSAGIVESRFRGAKVGGGAARHGRSGRDPPRPETRRRAAGATPEGG